MVTKLPLGKVAIIPMGDYDANTEYLLYNLVTYLGSSYLAIKDKFKGRNPVTYANNYWQLVAAGGGGSPILGSDSVLSWTS